MTGAERQAVRALVDEKKRGATQAEKAERVERDELWHRVNDATCDETGWSDGYRTRYVNHLAGELRKLKGLTV